MRCRSLVIALLRQTPTAKKPYDPQPASRISFDCTNFPYPSMLARVRRTYKKQADTTARNFDLVICSDVVYDEEVVPHFLKTMHALLDPPAVPQATTLLSNRTASPTATSRTETVAILGFKKRNRRRELLLLFTHIWIQEIQPRNLCIVASLHSAVPATAP